MSRTGRKLPSLTAVCLSVVVLLAAGASGAAAQRLITGKDIANGTVTTKDVKNKSLTGKDVKNGSLSKSDFSGSLIGPTGPRGPAGPQGPAGAKGARGPAGPAGDGADEYRTWIFSHKATDSISNGYYAPLTSQQSVTGPAVLSAVELVVPDQIKQWIRANCPGGGSVSISVGSMSAGWSWYAPADESEYGSSGGLIRNQSKPATGYVACQDGPPTYQGLTPIPDFDALLTFGIDYIEPESITPMD